MKRLLVLTGFLFVGTMLLTGSSSYATGVSNFSVCFSPAGHCDLKLVSFAASAKSTLDVAIYDFTLPNLAQALVKLNQSGVKVRMVVDKGEAHSKTSLIPALLKSGIPIKFGNVQGIMHNKFTIVDGRMLETGSFNYSNNATSMNAENQLYLDNPDVVNTYRAQFETLWANGLPAN